MKIAVLIPCYNEEKTIASVIQEMQKYLPKADIYIYDNNSTDDTYNIALKHKVILKKESRQGKGNVVRSMFREVNADVYVMIDGDDTYPADIVQQLIDPIINETADMTVGDRHSGGFYSKENKRPFHDLGNKMVTRIINSLFKSKLRDIMSGYRCFNSKFIKLIPVLSTGFEIEIEMTLHALANNYRITEIPVEYRDRPAGSTSKLNTYSDGIRILRTILWVFKDYKPLLFFGILSFILCTAGLAFGFFPILDYIRAKYVFRVPLAILATGLVLSSVISLAIGLILDTVSKFHRRNFDIQYKINKL